MATQTKGGGKQRPDSQAGIQLSVPIRVPSSFCDKFSFTLRAFSLFPSLNDGGLPIGDIRNLHIRRMAFAIRKTH
jgi:hypothetical protein